MVKASNIDVAASYNFYLRVTLSSSEVIYTNMQQLNVVCGPNSAIIGNGVSNPTQVTDALSGNEYFSSSLFTSSSTPCKVSAYSLFTDSGGLTVHPNFDAPEVGSELKFRIKSEFTAILGVYEFYIKTTLIGG